MSSPRIFVRLVGDRFTVEAGPRDADLLRTIPGLRYDHLALQWNGKATWPTALALRSVFGEALAYDEACAEWGWRQVQREQWAEALKAGTYRSSLAEQPWADGLYPFQVDGVAMLSEMGQVLLADEMGTGKTVQTAVALKRLDALGGDPYPVLVVCTNSMKDKWAEELQDWVPGILTYVVRGSAAKRRKIIAEAREASEEGIPAALIINWEGLRGHSRLAPYGSVSLKKCAECDKRSGDPTLKETACEVHPREFNGGWIRTVVADESHKAKDPKAKQTRALWAVAHAAAYRFALTGTPVTGQPEDLWAQMHLIAPAEWPSKSKFIDRYTVSSMGMWGLDVFGFNPATQPEMNRLVDARFIARPKSVVLADLPPVTYSVRHLDMEPKQAKAYKDMADHLIAVVDSEILTASDPLTKMTRLVQMASATPVIEPDEVTGVPMVVALQAPSCKVAALLDLIDEMGEKALVVFAESRKLLELAEESLLKKGVEVVSVTGTVNEAQRKVNVDTFQHGDAQVILVSLGAGAEGITLTAADTAVFLQRSWKMTANRQAEARIHRIGQEANRVEIIDFITKGTIEVAVHNTALDKEDVLQQVIRDPNWIRRAITGDT